MSREYRDLLVKAALHDDEGEVELEEKARGLIPSRSRGGSSGLLRRADRHMATRTGADFSRRLSAIGKLAARRNGGVRRNGQRRAGSYF